jgi:hypothetical protein
MKPEIVREALRQRLKQRAVERFEQGWKASLERHPDDEACAEDWLTVQEWQDCV